MTAGICALAGLALLLWFLLHGRRNGPGWEKFWGVRFAHRGLHGPGVPENSLAAFRAAVERGYGAELDVHLTADGRLAVLHDSDLQRMCGVTGTVEALPSAELAALRLEGTEERVPLLEEVLPLFEGRAPLIVELKPSQGNWNDLAAKTVDCLDRFHADYCVESFDPRVLRWLRIHRPEILRGQLAQDFFRRAGGQSWWNRFALTNLLYNVCARPDFVAYRFTDRNMPALRLCHRLGLRLVYWTLRTQPDLDAAERAGALPVFEGFMPKEEVE
jgi:glycerophosphoryl diester phosphodiesterase